MKRQVAITGPTPEFLRWSIRKPCVLRADLQPGSVDATEKRLRAIRLAGLAIARDQVFDGIAAKLIDGQPKAFRVNEIFQVFGGIDQVSHACHGCPVNVLNDSNRHGGLAGCHGWLPRRVSVPPVGQDSEIDVLDIAAAINQTFNESADLQQVASELFPSTSELWYGLWARRQLSGAALEFVTARFVDLKTKASNTPEAVADFSRVLEACVSQELILDVELVPPGFSDGLKWTIGAHCDHCRFLFEPEQQGCRCCQKSGKGHPEIHRKVRGLRPWVDLSLVIGADKVQGFLQRHELQQDVSGSEFGLR